MPLRKNTLQLPQFSFNTPFSKLCFFLKLQSSLHFLRKTLSVKFVRRKEFLREVTLLPKVHFLRTVEFLRKEESVKTRKLRFRVELQREVCCILLEPSNLRPQVVWILWTILCATPFESVANPTPFP